ncbi:MAG: T9SS type A sorting domain-containing protein [Calditrichaeota bacterium]|nr:T9SS type A sorting domain-containing protein [Calditrichota bacterium]
MKRLVILIVLVSVVVVTFQINSSAVPLTYYRHFTVIEHNHRENAYRWFWTPDTLDGPVRSNDFIGIRYSPTFFDQVISSQEDFIYYDPMEPHFEYPPIFNAPEYSLPESLPDLAELADSVIESDNGRLITRIVLQGEDGIEIHQMRLGRPLPEPGEEDNLIARADPPDDDVIYIDGQCEVYGVLGSFMGGRLTIYSSGDMFLIDNIIYEGVDPQDGDFDEEEMEHMLALISDRNIIIRNNEKNGRNNGGGNYNYDPDEIDHHSIAINGSLVALTGSFTFENQNFDWDPYQGPSPDERGIIFMKGSIAQYRRGNTHRSNHGGTGYGKRIRYDQRLKNQTPPGLDMYNDPDFFGGYDTLTVDQEFARFFSLEVRKLIIQAGSEIELYGDNALSVSDTLLVLGTADASVVFEFYNSDSPMIRLKRDTTFVSIQYAEFDSTDLIEFNGNNCNIENSIFRAPVSMENYTIENCTFYGSAWLKNIAVDNCTFNGTVVAVGDVSFLNCTFNSALDLGVCTRFNVERCVIRDGLEITNRFFEGSICNNTIVGSQNRAGIRIRYDNNLEVVNNIITDNHGGIWVSTMPFETELRFNDVFNNQNSNYIDCEAGEGSISVDPRFVNADSGDFHLQSDSPCIDTGDPDFPNDPDDSRSDMGAFVYEFNDVLSDNPPVATGFSIEAYPNPFNSQLKITYNLVNAGEVDLAVYDLSGKRVANLVKGRHSSGIHTTLFDGDGYSSGVYLVRLESGKLHSQHKVVLVK